VAFGQALYERFRQPIYEFTKFAVIGIAGHNKLTVFVALNLGIALATGFRFWSYRQFVWGAK
jgi:acid phosphatase family membrane protein YuiD